MYSFLILSNNATQRESKAREIVTNEQIHTFDISFLETEGSIGIEDVRNFQKQLFLKPLKGQKKAAIIKNAHTLTIEAQNALLKTLEEPPNNTYIFLTAATNHNLLPTILSRTSILSLLEEKKVDEKDMQEVANQLQQLFSATLGNKLKLAETLATDKTKTLNWMEEAIHLLREKLLKQLDNTYLYIDILQELQKTYTILKTTNANTRLALENLFLNLGI